MGEYRKRERRRGVLVGGDMVYMRAPRCLSLLRDERANLHPRRTGELVSELHNLTTVMKQLFDGEF